MFRSDIEHRLKRGEAIRMPARDANESAEDREKRVVDGHVLVALARATGEVKTPLVLEGAVVRGDLDLSSTDLLRVVSFDNTEFEGYVTFAFSSFRRTASFNGAVFHGDAVFRGADVKADLIWDSAVFKGALRGMQLSVGKRLLARGASFEAVDLNGLEASGDAVFSTMEGKPAVFGGRADFVGSHIAGQANFSSASFGGEAHFDLARIDGGLFFDPDQDESYPDLPRTHFGKLAGFIGAVVGRQANFTAACFDSSIECDGMSVDGDLDCTDVVVTADARFPGVRVTGQTRFTEAEFGGRFIAKMMKVGEEARFPGAVFKGPAKFDGACFHGPAVFLDPEDLEKVGAEDVKSACFEAVTFLAVTFESRANFRSARFNGSAHFDGAQFKLGAGFEDCLFAGKASFNGSSASGDVQFERARFHSDVSFQDATFHQVCFRGDVLRDAPENDRQFLGNRFDGRGFSYDRISVAWREVLSILQPFDIQPYRQMESAFRTMGKDQEAKEVYVTQRKRTLNDYFKSGRWAHAIRDALYFVVARFGVAPLRLLVVAFGLVLGWAFLFSQPNAVVDKVKSQPLTRSLTWMEGLAMSVNVFMPVEVPVGSSWRASDRAVGSVFGLPVTFAFLATILRLAGWLVVPLGVAVFTGWVRHDPGK